MRYGAGLYGGGTYGLANAYSATRAAQVVVYDRYGNMKGMHETGSSGLLSISFGHNEKGCGSFQMDFASRVDIEKSDTVRVHLFGSIRSFFCGVVRSTPIEGSTAQVMTYSGFGLNDYFVRLNAESLSYPNKTLDYIVNDVLDDIIVVKSPIQKLAGSISLPAITVTAFAVNYSQVSEVLDALKKIADSSGTEYVYGVDEEGYFFFRPRSTELKATLAVGKRGEAGIQDYEPSDSQEQRTKLFVLRNDGTLLTTLVTSEPDNDVFEEKVKGPDLDDVDLALWAAGYLAQRERAGRSASIEWPMEQREPPLVVADGEVRVLSSIPPSVTTTPVDYPWGDDGWGDGLFGGEEYLGYDADDTLSIKEITYDLVAGGGATRRLNLGEVPGRVEDVMAAVSKKLAELEISLGV